MACQSDTVATRGMRLNSARKKKFIRYASVFCMPMPKTCQYLLKRQCTSARPRWEGARWHPRSRKAAEERGTRNRCVAAAPAARHVSRPHSAFAIYLVFFTFSHLPDLPDLSTASVT